LTTNILKTFRMHTTIEEKEEEEEKDLATVIKTL
jgi:hypothetical protein